jgi:hypothetical protein
MYLNTSTSKSASLALAPYAGKLDVCFRNTLLAAIGAQYAAPLLPEACALTQNIRNGHLGGKTEDFVRKC